MKVPSSFQGHLWSADVSTLDTEKHQNYIIEQLLEYGNLEEWRWLLRTYANEDIIAILRRSRSVSPRSKSFWGLFFHVTLPNNDAYKRSAWYNRNRP